MEALGLAWKAIWGLKLLITGAAALAGSTPTSEPPKDPPAEVRPVDCEYYRTPGQWDWAAYDKCLKDAKREP